MEKIKNPFFDNLYLFFFILLPFIYYGKLVDPVLIPRQIFLTFFIFILTASISYKMYQRQLPADFSFLKLHVFIAFGSFLTFVLISTLQAIAISESMYVFSKFLIEALFFVITTYLLIQNKLQVVSLIKAVSIFCMIVLAQSIFQALKLSSSHPDFFDNMLNVSATFGHKNLLASILFFSTPFLLASNKLSKGWKTVSIISLLLVATMAWLLQTKVVIVAIPVFIVAFLLLFFKAKNSGTDQRQLKITVICVLSMALLAGIFTIANRQKFPRIFDTKSSFERLGLWNNSKEMIREHGVMGVGAGNWQVYFPKYGMDKFAEAEVKNGITTFQRPHNDFLWVFCEMGIGGFICYACIFIIMICYLIKLLKKRNELKHSNLFIAFLPLLICYLLIAFIDFPLERIEHQVILLLIFSITTATYYNLFRKEGNKVSQKASFLVLFFFVATWFSFMLSTKRWKGEYHTQRLYFFERTSNWVQMQKEAEAAYSLFYTLDPMSAPIEWYKGVALFSSGDVTGAKISFEKAYALHPYNMHVLNNLASCYESLGDHANAEAFYLKALTISSGFEEARLNLSAVYYNKKEVEKAFKTIDKCDVSSQDPKYKSFLQAILNSWLQAFIAKQKDVELVRNINALTSKNDVVSVYFESKKRGIDFKEYILINTTKIP